MSTASENNLQISIWNDKESFSTANREKEITKEREEYETKKYRKRNLFGWMSEICCCCTNSTFMQGIIIGILLGSVVLTVIITLWLTRFNEKTNELLSTSSTTTVSTTTTTATTTTTTATTTTSTTTTTAGCTSCSNYCWNRTGVAVVGTNTVPLSEPRCVYITSDDTIFLCTHIAGTVFSSTLNQSSLTALTTNYGNHMDYVTLSRNGSLYVNCHGQHNIRRYDQTTIPAGIIVAGSGSSVTGSLSGPRGIAVDDYFNLYIADTNNKRVVKLPAGGTNLMTVINATGYVTQLSALLLLHGTSNQIYLSDEGGTSVYLWTFGSTTPDATYRNVVGGTTLSSPRGLKLDPLGNLYVTDLDNNRVVMFCRNTTVGIVMMNTTYAAWDLAFDSRLNLYVFQGDGILYKYGLL